MNGNNHLPWSSVSKLLTVSRTHSQEFNWEKQRKWTCIWNWASHNVRPSKSWTEMTTYLEARFQYSLIFLKTFRYQCFKKLGGWGQSYSGHRKANINWNAMAIKLNKRIRIEECNGMGRRLRWFPQRTRRRGKTKTPPWPQGLLKPSLWVTILYCHFTTIE